MNNPIISVLVVVGGLSIVTLAITLWVDRRRYGTWVALHLFPSTVIEMLIVFAIAGVPLLFGQAQWEVLMGILLWIGVLIRGVQIVSMILNQPKIDESLLDLGNAHEGMGQAIILALCAMFAVIAFLGDPQTPVWVFPLAVMSALSAVYFAARSVRGYTMTIDGIWTPTNKIKWEQVTVCQLDTTPDGAPVLYVQARGDLLWRSRFAVKVAAQDKAALVTYIERYVPAAQFASA